MKNRNELVSALVQRSYCSYAIFVHDGRWVAGKLHRYLCNKVQEFVTRETGKAYEILALSVPPQHGKSQAITETLPSWYLGRYKSNRVIEISYNDDFALRFGRKNKAKVLRYGWALGIELGKAADKEFEITDGGSMISRGLGAGITGNPAELIIIDDPIKSRAEADSETMRRRLQEEWTDSIRTRLQAGGKVIVIQTRWHEDDLIGYLLRTEKNIEYINIPCEAEEGDVLGRKPGEALASEIGKGDEWLKEFKAGFSEGARTWNAMYQGRPASQEGNIVKREWWRYYTELPKLEEEIMSVDASFKDDEDSDYVAIQIWGRERANYYMKDGMKRRMDFPATIKMIMHMKGENPDVSAIYIEDKANGTAIISVLRKHISGIIGVSPRDSKISRVNAVSPTIESGNVYLPKGKDCADDLIEEFAAFPYGKNDDQVDACTQALNKLIFRASVVKEVEEKKAFNIDDREKNTLGEGDVIDVI